MKKIIFGGITVLAIAAAITFNVNLNSRSEKLSDVSLANVEALADGESDSNCRTGIRWTIEWNYEYHRNVCIMGGSACCA